jgi:catechol 2,3-dioxygenase-like lactoylglutathione lyase family enzyme
LYGTFDDRTAQIESSQTKSMKGNVMMKSGRALGLFLILCLVTAITVSKPRPNESNFSPAVASTAPTLINTCLITNNVEKLAAFYTQVLKMKPHKVDATYVEFQTDKGVLALFAGAAQDKYIPGSTVAGQNHSVVLEFRVADVGQEYIRLQGIVEQWVKAPTTQPWGTRSIYFRDPDGNLVNFFVPVAPQ